MLDFTSIEWIIDESTVPKQEWLLNVKNELQNFCSIFNGLALLFRGSVGAILNMMRLDEKYMEMEKQHEKSYHNKKKHRSRQNTINNSLCLFASGVVFMLAS